MANYPETEQTYQALINLRAVNSFVSFKMIFEEVQQIRRSRNLKPNPSNLIGRVRRSLINNEETFKVNSSEQSNKLSIAKQFPNYAVKPKRTIPVNEKRLAISTKDIEENSFCLIQK
ncbi:hypothetical protein GCM10011416_01050 [Polaribacter pacificus]|uniref:Uncharacterized protein n=1 Tax=Polaribacter pacificus TaxID=1775173 RepID=A0A917MAZ3_9FLAO|nr:hypothetical protein [Polaribacter pacificus]GGG88570.1 hypothetical protein GCM10011416_01050 [Polaribacter pacificus]